MIMTISEQSGSGLQVTGPVLHWYDFLCPFCYVAQQRNAILRAP
jgi:hypothetical protein